MQATPPFRPWLGAALAAVAFVFVITLARMPSHDGVAVGPPQASWQAPSPRQNAPTPRPSLSPAPTEDASILVEVFPDSLALFVPGGAFTVDGPDEVTVTAEALRTVVDRWPLDHSHAIP